MKTGDVFLALLSVTEPKKHFWVIVLAITEEGTAILGNITSNSADKTLRIFQAEYECLSKKCSFFNFPEMEILPLASLEERRLKHQIIPKPAISADLLKQIQEGAILSPHTPQNIKKILKKYLKK